MANTRDTLGDQATVDALIANTLTDLEEDGITTLRSHALRNRTTLQSVNFPNLKTINTFGLAYCTKLTSVEIPAVTLIETYTFMNDTGLTALDLSGSSAVTIKPNAFYGCSNLTHLVIRSTSISTLDDISALNGTKIAIGEGGIYVPSNLLSSYKSASNWSSFAGNIFPIDDYPRTSFDSITDSWEQIIAAANDGSYTSKYSIGDTKNLDFGSEGVHKMQIVAFDEDDLADNSGKAHITFICKDLLPTRHNMNASSTSSGGYEATAMRSYLSGTILPKLPAEVQAAIKEVTKVQSTYSSGVVKDGQTTTEKLWIPSNHEVGLGTTYETTGAVYSSIFSSNTKRIKHRNGTANSWRLRSVYTMIGFCSVAEDGKSGSGAATNVDGVVPGFCI